MNTTQWRMRFLYIRRRPFRGVALAALAALAACALAPPPARAQTPPSSEIETLRAAMDSLRAELDSLRAVMAREGTAPAVENQAEDALARLRAAAQAAAEQGRPADADETSGPEQQFVGRQTSLQALNPEISVTGDVFGRVGSDEAGSDNFVDREFEFAFQSNLDPFSRAKIFVGHHNAGGELPPFGAHGHGSEEGAEEEGHGGEFAIEEAYVQWVGLPGGLGIKLGRIYQQFGTLNRWHAHALQFQSRALPHLAFIGEESLSQAGASIHWLAPIEGFGTWELTGEVTRAGNELLFGESDRVSVLGHVNSFWQLTPSFDLDLGVSAMTGRHVDEDEAFDQRLFGVEGALTWAPPGRSGYRGLTVRGGIMVHDRSDFADAAGEAASGGSARGAWVWTEARVGRSWYVGGRWEWVENPEDTAETAWLAGPSLTWWQSEYVRLRAEYDFLGGPENEEGQLLLQVTFSMGPHKHETY